MATSSTEMLGNKSDYSKVEEKDKEALNLWVAIKAEIDALKQAVHHREKKQKAIQISTKISENLISLMGLFFKYPSIKEEYETYQVEITHFSQYINENIQALENHARQYFEAYCKENGIKLQNIQFFPKKAGIQVGRKAVISYLDESSNTAQQLSYFIKTHQHGSASGSGSNKPVDPKELFVYKVLEYIGLGPETHFFFNPLSRGGFYIATRDLGSSKFRGKQKNKAFHDYESIKSTLVADADYRYGVTQADIISRIFCLRDVTTNASNFGFVFNEDKKKCKIVDFRIESQDTYEYIDIFQGFLDGNGIFNYFDAFLKSTLKDRPEVERLTTAEAIVQALSTGGKKMSLVEAIHRANQEVVSYINRNQSNLGINISEDPSADFNKYVASVKINFQKFCFSLQKKISYKPSSSSLGLIPSQLLQYINLQKQQKEEQRLQDLQRLIKWLEEISPHSPKDFLLLQLRLRLIKGYHKSIERFGIPAQSACLRFKFNVTEFEKFDIHHDLQVLLGSKNFYTEIQDDKVFVTISVKALTEMMTFLLENQELQSLQASPKFRK